MTKGPQLQVIESYIERHSTTICILFGALVLLYAGACIAKYHTVCQTAKSFVSAWKEGDLDELRKLHGDEYWFRKDSGAVDLFSRDPDGDRYWHYRYEQAKAPKYEAMTFDRFMDYIRYDFYIVLDLNQLHMLYFEDDQGRLLNEVIRARNVLEVRPSKVIPMIRIVSKKKEKLPKDEFEELRKSQGEGPTANADDEGGAPVTTPTIPDP